MTPELADELGVDEGTSTMLLTRLRRADGVPMALERVVLHPDVAGVVDGLDGSLHAAFEAKGRKPSRALARVTARLATEEERELLQLPTDGVVLVAP